MTIRNFKLQQQPTDLLIRRLQKCPTDRTTYEELCRRQENATANQIINGEYEDRALESMGGPALARHADALNRELVVQQVPSGLVA